MNFKQIFTPSPEKIEDAEKENSKINFPENINIIKSLQEKLSEYKERLNTQIQKDPYKSPALFIDTNYKIAVLEKLLINGEVDINKLSEELIQKFGNLDINTFHNACAVIENYAKTGGAEVEGGTGLKLEKKSEIIKNTNNFDELYKALEKIGGIQGSRTFYDSEELKNIINQIKKGEVKIDFLTRNEGLREKVEELLSNNNQEAKEKLTPEKIENSIKNGKMINVKVQRSSGEIEEGWTIKDSDGKNAIVVKSVGGDKYLRKIISIEKLQELNN